MTDRPADTHVALLRGVNVGGKNRVPMKELAQVFAGMGCRDVRTYIQSGNVVFAADPSLALRLPGLLPAVITERFGVHTPVVLRTAAELEEAQSNNPFVARGEDPATLHLALLQHRPAPEALEALDPDRSPPDEFEVRGRDIHLLCPNGMARTKLTTGYFDKRLDTVSTIRNWRTVGKLVEMLRAG